jgi:tetratricopeptide (TPR) repeat protein
VWLGAAAVLVLLIGVGAFVAYQRMRSPAPAEVQQQVSVLVSDFANGTSEEVFDGTLEPALTIALEGAKFINSYPRVQARRVGSAVKPGATVLDEDVARLVAIREGITVVVSGAIERQGAAYSIQARALDAVTGKVLGGSSVSAASKDEVLAVVGKLAAGIRQALGDSTPESAQLAAAETFTAASLEAAHAYATAQELQGSGQWDKAIPQYERAIKADPDLGRAYSGLAVVYANLGQPQKAEAFYQQALARVHRMTDREKYRTRGAYYLMVRQPRKAIEEFNALLAEFPHDEAALSNLALSHFYLREMDKAIEHGRRAVENSGNGLRQRTNLALYALYAGDYALAEKSAAEILERNPEFPIARLAVGMAQLGTGDTAKAAATFASLEKSGGRGASMARLAAADLKLYEGRVQEAIALLEQAIVADLGDQDKSSAAVKLNALGAAYSLAGVRTKAVQAADRALQLDQTDATVFAAARIYLEQRQEAKALKLASQLAARIELEPQIYGKLLEGEAQLGRGDAHKALALFQDAQRLADTWLGRVDLGRAYLAAGAYTEASSEFEIALRRRGEASAVFLDDLPTFRYLPGVYYDLGRAQEGLKSPAAYQSFTTFLEIKKNGDQIPLVADAQRRANIR